MLVIIVLSMLLVVKIVMGRDQLVHFLLQAFFFLQGEEQNQSNNDQSIEAKNRRHLIHHCLSDTPLNIPQRFKFFDLFPKMHLHF